MIKQTRKDGIAIDMEEYIEGIRGFAVPLKIHRANTQIAIWAVGLKRQITDEIIPRYAEYLKKIAAEIVRDEHGIVLIDNALCIGCRECLEACPFGAMQFDDDAEVAVKCDLCIERLKNNEQPACSQACATQCIFWGDTKKLHHKIDSEIQ